MLRWSGVGSVLDACVVAWLQFLPWFMLVITRLEVQERSMSGRCVKLRYG